MRLREHNYAGCKCVHACAFVFVRLCMFVYICKCVYAICEYVYAICECVRTGGRFSVVVPSLRGMPPGPSFPRHVL